MTPYSPVEHTASFFKFEDYAKQTTSKTDAANKSDSLSLFGLLIGHEDGDKKVRRNIDGFLRDYTA